MRKQALNLLVAAAIMGHGVAIATSVNAAYLLKYEEVGADVVAKGSGSLDTTDLSLVGSGVGSCFGAAGLFALACVGPQSIDIDNYRGFVGPLSFGPGTTTFLDSSGSGDFTGIIGRTGFLDLPGGYISRSFLSGEATFANSDFQDVGLTPGTYVWSWGTGPDADTFTVQIGVPEPSSWALLLAGFGALGLIGYRRTRKSRAIG
jgi:PEP-CTERM motif